VNVAALCPAPRWCSARDAGGEPELPDHRDGYRLEVRGGEALIDAAHEPGRYYAARTMDQLRRANPDGVDDLVIVDWPDLPNRGVMLDASRNKVPTAETLELMIERLAALKINHVELYLEATFAHPGHEDVWGDRCPYTVADVARLRARAATHHVELIGQQNSLGHMEHWLAAERLAHLAVLPGGYQAPGTSGDAGHEPAACLDPANPESFELVAELVINMAEAFGGRRVHVGLDEPIDMNPAVWDAIFEVPGAEPPWAEVDNGSFCVPLPPAARAQYVDWIRRLRALPALDGRDMLMWADVMAPHPELLADLPPGVTLVEWGYEADHAFDARCGRIAAAGRPFWVAPGTSGRIANMVANIAGAARAAADHDGEGMLVTAWGVNPDAVNWPGFATAAAQSWNRAVEPDLAAVLDLAVAQGHGLGDVWREIGTVDDLITPGPPETGAVSELFRTSGMAGIGLALGGMTDDMLTAADDVLANALDGLASATGDALDFELLRSELAWSTRCLRWGIGMARHRLTWPTAPPVEWLRTEHGALVDEHRHLWSARNRMGGLEAVNAQLAGTLGGI